MQSNRTQISFPEKCEGSSSDSSDSEDIRLVKRRPKPEGPVKFRCIPETEETENDDDFFVLDVNGTDTVNSNDPEKVSVTKGKAKTKKKKKKKAEATKTLDTDAILDEKTKELLSRSIIKPGFEKYLGEGHVPMSLRAMKKQRKIERERTKGDAWYNLPAGEMTEEAERDLEILQMRAALDTKTHYRKNDRSVLPKYFQVGTVIETKADFYSSRIPKKERKRTIVEELLSDMDFQTKQRKKYQEIKAREAITKRGAFRRSSYPRKKRKFRHNPGA